MPKPYKTSIDQLADGISLLSLVASIVTHSKGFTRVYDATHKAAWEALFRADWEYHVSPFTD